MRPEAYENLNRREDSYWWNRARRDMAAGLLRRHGLGSGARILDLGCGMGGNISVLAAEIPSFAVGLDLSPIAIGHARERHPSLPLVRADLNAALPLADASVDAVTIFNVLYHQWVRDEVAVLKEVRRILRPGGLLLATEPAFWIFARQMDEIVLTRRRYRIPEFAGLCREAGLHVRFSSYFGSFGAPVVLVTKAMDRLFQRSSKGHVQADLKPIGGTLNELMYSVAHAEASMIASGVPMPVGLTLAVVARK